MRDEIKAIKKEQEDAKQLRKATSDKLDHMYEVLLDFVARSK
jgi:pyrroloquinoline quinone (PQQ) biosynthesis protein C